MSELHFDGDAHALLTGGIRQSVAMFARENLNATTEVLSDSQGNYRPVIIVTLPSGKRIRVRTEVLADGEPSDPQEAEAIASLNRSIR